MVDISMGGTTVVVNFADGNKQITLTDFSDEGTPIDISGLQIADGAKNMNGFLVTWTKPSVITVSFTLIPGSDDDFNLRAHLQAQFLAGGRVMGQGGSLEDAYISSMVIKSPAYSMLANDPNLGTTKNCSREFTFKRGRLQSGPTALGSNNEGKASPSTYTFMFEDVEYNTTWSSNSDVG